MDKVDVDAIYRRCELRQGVKPSFGIAPVIFSGPVTHKFAERGELQPLRSVINRLPVGQACRSDASAKVKANNLIRVSQSAVKRKQASRELAVQHAGALRHHGEVGAERLVLDRALQLPVLRRHVIAEELARKAMISITVCNTGLPRR